VELLGRQVGREAREQRDRHLGRGVVDPLARLRDQPADHQADDDAAGDPAEELERRRPEGERAADRGRHRGAVDDERGAVVDQALALDDVDQPPRRAQPLHDRRGRDRVGGSEDAAQHERRGPGQVQHVVRRHGDDRRGEQHEPDGQQRYRPQVAAQVAQVGEEGRHVQQRRQEDHEHQVRLELRLRETGQQAQHQAAQHEQDRVGHVDLPGDHAEPRQGDEQDQDQ
jgi:hypothetical protein